MLSPSRPGAFEANVTVAMTRRRVLAHATLAGAVALGAVLFVYPPGDSSLYPQCPVHRYLHLLCPGCGATRALAALLHGHLREALRFNALFVLLLPFALAFAVECYRRALRTPATQPFDWPQLPSSALYTTLAVAATFTMMRNLPQ